MDGGRGGCGLEIILLTPAVIAVIPTLLAIRFIWSLHVVPNTHICKQMQSNRGWVDGTCGWVYDEEEE